MALILCLSAQAGSYIRTHEDYVHLSDYEKNQLIIKTMELVVALESQYNYEVKKFGYNSERFEKFNKAVSKVKSILPETGVSPSFTEKTKIKINPHQKMGIE